MVGLSFLWNHQGETFCFVEQCQYMSHHSSGVCWQVPCPWNSHCMWHFCHSCKTVWQVWWQHHAWGSLVCLKCLPLLCPSRECQTKDSCFYSAAQKIFIQYVRSGWQGLQEISPPPEGHHLLIQSEGGRGCNAHPSSSWKLPTPLKGAKTSFTSLALFVSLLSNRRWVIRSVNLVQPIPARTIGLP